VSGSTIWILYSELTLNSKHCESCTCVFVNMDDECGYVAEARRWWWGVRDSVSNTSEPSWCNHWPWWKQSEGDARGLLALSHQYSLPPFKYKLIIIIIIICMYMNSTGITFLSKLGHRLTSVTGDLRETTYLFQWVSLAVQWYSSVAFKGTFLVPTKLDQCHSSQLCF